MAALLSVIMIFAIPLMVVLPWSAQGSVKSEPSLSIISCPEKLPADCNTAWVEGVISDDDSKCTLYINGENILSTENKGEQVRWNKSYILFPGEVKQLDFEVVDDDGHRVRASRVIICEKREENVESTTVSVPTVSYPSYVEGTRLVKKTNDPKSTVNIRKYPNMNSASFEELGAGQTAIYLWNEGNGWYRIITPKGNEGYICAEYVQPASETSYSATLYNGCKLVKKTRNPKSTVNIRKAPDKNSASFEELGVGQTATFISDYGNGWYRIRTPKGAYGYISAEYVKIAY